MKQLFKTLLCVHIFPLFWHNLQTTSSLPLSCQNTFLVGQWNKSFFAHFLAPLVNFYAKFVFQSWAIEFCKAGKKKTQAKITLLIEKTTKNQKTQKSKRFFPKTLGGVSFEKLVNFVERENPFFSIKRVLSLHTSLSQKNDQRPCRSLDSGQKEVLLDVLVCFLACCGQMSDTTLKRVVFRQ